MFTIYFYGIKMFLVKLLQQKIPYSEQEENCKKNVKTTNVFKNNVTSQYKVLHKSCNIFY